MLTRNQIQTPRQHGQVLVVPDARTQHAARNAAAPDLHLLGRRLPEIRAALWQRLGWQAPVVITGHQAEFIHPGVYAKSIAAASLAQGGTSVYLTVDSDTPKTTELVVPRATGQRIQLHRLPCPGIDPRLPIESQQALDVDAWSNWFRQLRTCAQHNDSWLDAYQQGWQSVQNGSSLTDAFIAAHTASDNVLGIKHQHVRTSDFGTWPEFRAFALSIARDAERFAKRYNDAQRAYRARHGVRTDQRPVPLLEVTVTRIELPFWITRPGGTRERLYVSRGATPQFLLGGRPIGALPDGDDWSAAESSWSLDEAGWQLRPRALTLSGFCRLVAAPVFIHGIGGAKYDELTDDFTRSFWGADLQPLACVSAALLLDLPHAEHPEQSLATARYRVRDAQFNPHRQVKTPDRALVEQRSTLIAENRRLAEHDRRNRVARRDNHRALHDNNQAQRAKQQHELQALQEEVEAAESQLAQAAIARGREYFHGLFPHAAIEQLAAGVRALY